MKDRNSIQILRDWSPFISAIAVAISSLIVAIIASSASRGNTQKDYVALAISVLESPQSSEPSKRWAVEVLSKLSPVEIPKPLKDSLISGKDAFPIEPLPCLNQLRDSGILNEVAPAPLPDGNAVKGWISFGVQQSGQLQKANNNLKAAREILEICTKETPIPVE